MTNLQVTHRKRRERKAHALVIADHGFQYFDGLLNLTFAHVLVRHRGAQQRVARLKRQPLLQFIFGKLKLILILVDRERDGYK